MTMIYDTTTGACKYTNNCICTNHTLFRLAKEMSQISATLLLIISEAKDFQHKSALSYLCVEVIISSKELPSAKCHSYHNGTSFLTISKDILKQLTSVVFLRFKIKSLHITDQSSFNFEQTFLYMRLSKLSQMPDFFLIFFANIWISQSDHHIFDHPKMPGMSKRASLLKEYKAD